MPGETRLCPELGKQHPPESRTFRNSYRLIPRSISCIIVTVPLRLFLLGPCVVSGGAFFPVPINFCIESTSLICCFSIHALMRHVQYDATGAACATSRPRTQI